MNTLILLLALAQSPAAPTEVSQCLEIVEVRHTPMSPMQQRIAPNWERYVLNIRNSCMAAILTEVVVHSYDVKGKLKGDPMHMEVEVPSRGWSVVQFVVTEDYKLTIELRAPEAPVAEADQ